MYKKIIIILIILGVSTCSKYNFIAFGNQTNNAINQKLTAKDKLQERDFVIDGLYINQPIEEAIKIFGKPIKIKKRSDELHGVEELNYYFPDVSIITSEVDKKVFQINIKSRNIKTFRGVTVGDNEEDVFYHYGKTKKLDNKILRYQMYVNYETSDSQYILEFSIQKNKVSEIMIYVYSPD
jgi:hypothetical protein